MASQPPAPFRAASGNATLALVLGILGLVGGLGSCCCCLFVLLAICAPIAWVLGHRELTAIREGRSPAAGEGAARAGMICGMVGSGILALYLLGVLIYVALVGFGAATELLKHGGVPPLPR
jgi:hypothetical protein